MKTFIYLCFLLLINLFSPTCTTNMKKSILEESTAKSKSTLNIQQADNNVIDPREIVSKNWYRQTVNSCSSANCPPQYGTCLSQTICKCNKGYTIQPDDKKGATCGYEQKKQLNAFLLEFFVMGIGHIYTGAIITGVLKLLFIVLFPCLLLCLVFLGILVESDIKSQTCFLISSVIISIIYVLVVIFWYFYDIINFGKNAYLDGNGVPLDPW